MPLPAKLPIWQLASFKIDRDSLRERIGSPHRVEKDSSRTFGGEEDCWGFVTDSSQRIVLALRAPYQEAVIYADPPDATRAIDALSAVIGDSAVSILDRPYLET